MKSRSFANELDTAVVWVAHVLDVIGPKGAPLGETMWPTLFVLVLIVKPSFELVPLFTVMLMGKVVSGKFTHSAST